MPAKLLEIFEDEKLVRKIQSRLPYLFQLAEMESSRAGKIGMEVGSLREQIIIALLIYKFGEENVDTTIPITEPMIDVCLFGEPLSIKTITGKSFGGVKLTWTVDAQKAKEFQLTFQPKCDLLLVQVNWNDEGGLFYIPLQTQQRHFQALGKDKFIKLPKEGTNPRGVEIS
ncbi:MAG: ThaI family type II restriction endonuclease, partial [bacterium]